MHHHLPLLVALNRSSVASTFQAGLARKCDSYMNLNERAQTMPELHNVNVCGICTVCDGASITNQDPDFIAYVSWESNDGACIRSVSGLVHNGTVWMQVSCLIRLASVLLDQVGLVTSCVCHGSEILGPL
jgi:hypothetical protein